MCRYVKVEVGNVKLKENVQYFVMVITQVMSNNKHATIDVVWTPYATCSYIVQADQTQKENYPTL